VIAPDLPGLGAVEQPALGSIAEYAAWLDTLLDELSVERAAFVGNSFGGAVAWSLAGRYPKRCARLVLVNGFPVPKTPPLLNALGQMRPFRRLLSWVVAKVSYDPKRVASAFVSNDNVPEDLHRLIIEEWSFMVPRFADILIAGDGAPPSAVKPLLLWGAADRLPGTSRHHAHKIQQRLSGASLVFIENAGHFPQLEDPEGFVRALDEFLK
jgi:pimeloyl-ACP methyl ester carboxylesterase